mgnify:CR=1 FL=1
MFRTKKNIRCHEQYRLMKSVEASRKSWSDIKAWRISGDEVLHSEMPCLLAEMRYRYLLSQARKRGWVNHWYFETS